MSIVTTRVTIVASLVLALNSCVLPKSLPDANPYGSAIIGFIEPGVSTKSEIEQGLGTPFYTFANGKWWSYCADRKEAEWLWFVLAQYNVVGGTFGGEDVPYSLVLQFGGDDVVDDVFLINDEDGCVRRGALCHDCGFLEIREDGERTRLIGSLGSEMD